MEPGSADDTRGGQAPPPAGFSLPGPAPHRRRIPRPLVATAVPVILLATVAAVGILTRPAEDTGDVVAERFVRGLRTGGAPFDATPEGPAGFRVAWDVLAPEARAAVPLTDFIEEWMQRAERFGFLVDAVRVDGAQTFRRRPSRSNLRPVRFKLFFGAEGSPSTEVPLSVHLDRRGRSWVVERWEVGEPREYR